MVNSLLYLAQYKSLEKDHKQLIQKKQTAYKLDTLEWYNKAVTNINHINKSLLEIG